MTSQDWLEAHREWQRRVEQRTERLVEYMRETLHSQSALFQRSWEGSDGRVVLQVLRERTWKIVLFGLPNSPSNYALTENGIVWSLAPARQMDLASFFPEVSREMEGYIRGRVLETTEKPDGEAINQIRSEIRQLVGFWPRISSEMDTMSAPYIRPQ